MEGSDLNFSDGGLPFNMELVLCRMGVALSLSADTDLCMMAVDSLTLELDLSSCPAIKWPSATEGSKVFPTPKLSLPAGKVHLNPVQSRITKTAIKTTSMQTTVQLQKQSKRNCYLTTRNCNPQSPPSHIGTLNALPFKPQLRLPQPLLGAYHKSNTTKCTPIPCKPTDGHLT